MKSFKSFLTELAFKANELSKTDSGDMGSSHSVEKYKDSNGTTYFVKSPNESLYDAYNDKYIHILVEYLSYEIYTIFGIKTPSVDIYIKDDDILLASQESHGKHVNFDDLVKYKDFVLGFCVDLFICNWDVAGSGDYTGNLIIDSRGNVSRIDLGGSLSFRARGGRKFEKFSNHVGEYETMRDEDKSQVAKAYNTHEHLIKESFKNFFSISWSTLQSKLLKFNQINIIEPINELIEDSELKLDILQNWQNEFEEILSKLENRYNDLRKIFTKL